jgi:hypothetical protein
MPKEFFTEKDIEDLFKRGVTSLDVNDNIVLTGLAYEKAQKLGMKLVSEKAAVPPAAPIRPYVSKPTPAPALLPVHKGPAADESAGAYRPCTCAAAGPESEKALHDRIRTAVNARLGAQVDPALLDVIIRRVIAATGVH